MRLQEEAARGFAAASHFQRIAGLDVALLAHDLVQETGGLARVARDLAHAFLVVVQLFQRDHRQEHVVLLEPEEARRIVHEHVRVEHEELRRRRFRGAAGFTFTSALHRHLHARVVTGRFLLAILPCGGVSQGIVGHQSGFSRG